MKIEEADPKLDPEAQLSSVLKELREIKDIVLRMDARQVAIKQEVAEAPAFQPQGSFATGYQKEKE